MPQRATEEGLDPSALRPWWEEHSELDHMVQAVAKLLADSSLDAAREAVRALEETLEGHFATEETTYFPLVERFAPEEGGTLDAVQQGHDQMRGALGKLHELLAGDDRRAAREVLEQLLEGLKRHEIHEKRLIQRLAPGSSTS